MLDDDLLNRELGAWSLELRTLESTNAAEISGKTYHAAGCGHYALLLYCSWNCYCSASASAWFWFGLGLGLGCGLWLWFRFRCSCIFLYICMHILCPPSFVLKITARNQFHAIEALNFYQFINWFRWPFVAPVTPGVCIFCCWFRGASAFGTLPPSQHPLCHWFAPLSPFHWALAGQIIAKKGSMKCK